MLGRPASSQLVMYYSGTQKAVKNLNLYGIHVISINAEKDFIIVGGFVFIDSNQIDVLNCAIFSDEACFDLSGYIMFQNSRVWSSEKRCK